MYFYSIGQEGVRFLRIVSIVTLVSFFFHRGEYRNFFKNLWYPIQNRLMVFYLIFLQISQSVSIVPEYSDYAVGIIQKMVLMYFIMTAIVESEKQLRVVMHVFIVSYILLSWWATGKYYEGFRNFDNLLMTVNFSYDRNDFAMLFAMVMPFCVLYPFTLKKFHARFIVWCFAPIMMNVVYITTSRGGFLGMVVGGISAVLGIRKKAIMAVVLIFGIMFGARLMSEAAGTRISTIFVEPEERDAASISRISAWKRALYCIGENPLGIGPYCFKFYRAEEVGLGGGLSTHNFYLQVAAEQGIASGIILVFWLIICLLDIKMIKRRAKRDQRWNNYYYYATAIETSLYAFIVSSFFLSLSMFEPFYFLIGLVVCLKNVFYREYYKRSDYIHQ